MQSRFDAARADLRAVREGKLPLGPDANGVAVASPSQNLPEFNAGSKVWGRDAATGGAA